MAEYIEYHPLKFWLDPASIAEIVAHIQTYLVNNPINSTTEIETIIHDYLIAHPELIGGVRSINGETGEVVLTADNISAGENVTIKDVLDTLQDQIDVIVASIPSDYQELVDDVAEIKEDIYATENYTDQIELGSINTTSGANVNPGTDRIRTKSYLDLSVKSLIFNSGYTAYIYGYTQTGAYVGGYTGTTFNQISSQRKVMRTPIDLNELSAFNYKYRLVWQKTGSNTPDIDELNLNAVVNSVTVIKNSLPEIYTVGTGGDFTTFTEMLIALEQDTSEKIVYIKPGVYDIFDEMGGAEYMASLNTSGVHWSAVNHIVPPNTTIIGLGDVTLSWNPSDTEIIDQAHAFLFSPLNLRGTCTIKNIKILCTNCRYGIHDETSALSQFNEAIHTFENVTVIYSASTYGQKYAYGAGHNARMKLYFKDCLFSSAYSESWSTHDSQSGLYDASQIVFDNCIFINNATGNPARVRFSSSDTVGRLDSVRFNSSYLREILFSTENNYAIKQGYDVTLIACPLVTTAYNDNIAAGDRIVPKQYLTIYPQG